LIPASVIVVSYHTGPILWDCLEAALAAPETAELILVDNGNPPEVQARLAGLAAREARLTYAPQAENLGFAAGANRGAALSTGAALCFLNPDAVMAPGALRQLVATLGGPEKHRLVGGLIRGVDGQEQRGCRREEVTLWSAFVSASGLSRLEQAVPAFRELHRNKDPMPAEAQPMPVVSGAFVCVGRALFDALGGFDEGYFLHVEDVDFCRRARAIGAEVLFEPRAAATHAGATSAVSSSFVRRAKAAGFRRYFLKFASGPVDRTLVRVAGVGVEAALALRGSTHA
jgi:N-acetylglucosaminyl-diphospho-decaprenol L-rhamnosyltransferase